MEKSIKVFRSFFGGFSGKCGALLLGASLFLAASAGAAQDREALLKAPTVAPYEWFASTDPERKNADYIPLQPGATKEVPLAAGTLVRLWSTAFEPDKITVSLRNGGKKIDLLSGNKAHFGELYERALTVYPTESTSSDVRELKSDATLVATNHSSEENKWFYQVSVRPSSAARPDLLQQDSGTSANATAEKAARFDPEELDEILLKAAQLGEEKLRLSEDAQTPYRLHSAYGSMRSRKGEPIPILKVRGSGAFVGLVLDIRPAPDTVRRTFAFLEGNELLITDGKEYEGTGTEDYFNSSWYYPDEPFYRDYHGMTYKGFDPPRVTTYRWMVTDAVPFQESFEFQLEHGNGNNSDDLEYRWIAFWYQKGPADFTIENELTGGASGQGGAAAEPAGDETNILLGEPEIWGVGALIIAVGVAAFLVTRRRQESDEEEEEDGEEREED